VSDDARLSAKRVAVLRNLCQKVITILPCMLLVYSMIVGLFATKNIGSLCLVQATSIVLIFANNDLHVLYMLSVV
jgi:hypothetical protein